MLLASLPTLMYLTVFFKHLVWILGLKPGAGGALKPGRAVEGPSTVSNPAVSIDLWFFLSAQAGKKLTSLTPKVLTTAVMTDLPIISNILSRLFESSQ